MESIIGQQIGNYTIEKSLGEGGMADVYLAKNALGKKFTIKILKSELFSKAVIRQRFENEAKVMLSLDHPHIRQVIDFYEEKNLMAIIMEYLDGQDLDSYIEKNGAVSLKQAIDWFKHILPAFSYTHEQDIVHRDVKPSNLFLTKNGSIKVLDFGIAKIIDNNLSLTGTASKMGTPMYMSPEQIQTPKEVDYRTDIYSLGVTLYVLLTGQKPYDDTTDSEFGIQTKIVNQPLPEIPNLSSKVNHVIAKSTAKDPKNRYVNGEQFLKALLATDSQPVIEEKKVEKVMAEKPKIEPKPATKNSVKQVIEPSTSSKKVSTPWLKYVGIVIGTLVVVLGGLIWIGKNAQKEPAKTEPFTPITQEACRLNRVSFSDGSYNQFSYNQDGTLHELTTARMDEKSNKVLTTTKIAYNTEGLASRYTYKYGSVANGYADFTYKNQAITTAETYDSNGKLYQKSEFTTNSKRQIIKQKITVGEMAGSYFDFYYDERGNITKWEQVDEKGKTKAYTLYTDYDDKYSESVAISKGLLLNPVDGYPFMTNNYHTYRYYEADANGALQLKEESIMSDFKYNDKGFITENKFTHASDKSSGVAKCTYSNCL